ncbi:MAG: Na+/H+ antiporter NhaA [Cellvibrionaceae bacterium]|nr:Na+/H+ antiporter NhaA [Cellvibrionaceae bacterium]
MAHQHHQHRLPNQYIDRFTKPFNRFLSIQAAGGVVLLLAAIVATLIANSQFVDEFRAIWETPVGVSFGSWAYTHPLKSWVNDALMTFFFFLVAVELKRELVLGELRDPKMAALSIFAASGGMLVPAVVYLLLQWNEPGRHGWGTVMATDTAFVICCVAMLGKRVPTSLRVFMLSLAIVDDIGAILVVAIGYSGNIFWGALGIVALGLIVILAMARLGVRSFPSYFLVGGFIWLALESSGIHATIAGVVLGLMTPARRWVNDQRLYSILSQVVAHPTANESSGDTKDRATLQLAEIAARESLSAVERLQIGLHPWVGFAILPIFALANAGMTFSLSSLDLSVTWAVFWGFVIGKPLGVMGCAWLAIRIGVAKKPADLSWALLIGGSVLTGIGFTMALLIADIAFEEELLAGAKLGILMASVFSAFAGTALLLLGSSKRSHI